MDISNAMRQGQYGLEQSTAIITLIHNKKTIQTGSTITKAIFNQPRYWNGSNSNRRDLDFPITKRSLLSEYKYKSNGRCQKQ